MPCDIDLVGFEDHNISSPNIEIYPIPVEKIIQFKSKEEIIEIHLRDLFGNRVLYKRTKSTIIQLDISTFLNGCYIAAVIFKNGMAKYTEN